MAGRVEYMRGWKRKREGIPSSSADSEPASCTSSMAGVSYTPRRKGRVASTYPLLDEEVIGLKSWLVKAVS
jgi:hypothetical protein